MGKTMKEYTERVQLAIIEIRESLQMKVHCSIQFNKLTHKQAIVFGQIADKYKIKLGNLTMIYFGICNYGTNRKY